MYVRPTKRIRLAFNTSLGRELTTFDEQRPHVKTVYYVKITNVNKFGISYSLGKSLDNDLGRLLTICKQTCKLNYFRPTSSAHMFTVTEAHVWRNFVILQIE